MPTAPLDSAWIVLNRLDFLYDEQTGDGLNTNSWRVVNHLNGNYQPNSRMQVSTQYAFKYVAEAIEDDTFSDFTDLIGIEARIDVLKRWDIGLRSIVLHSWNSGQLTYSFGPSIGFNPAKNMWISLGYNFGGFDDQDFSGRITLPTDRIFNFVSSSIRRR